jgi:peptidoglycan/LPS O-acetylase OafA/YrhL
MAIASGTNGPAPARGPGELHIPSLDGLRALSFGLVFTSHAGVHAIPGGFGVTVFFFLSGFLITTLMRIEYERTHHVGFGRFYLRRALRILPPFYLVLLSATLLAAVGFVQGALRWQAVTAQALHYANYWIVFHDGAGGIARGTGVYWSLAVEEHFYLLFPLGYSLLRRSGASGRRQATAFLALCGLIFAWRCVLFFAFGASEDRTGMASETRFDSILFGCALAVYGNPVLDAPRIGDRTWKWGLLPLGLIGLLASFVFRADAFRQTFRYTLQGICLVPVFVCAMRFPRSAAGRVLNLRPLAFLGVLSYSLYLIHLVVLYAVEFHAGGRLGTPAVALLSLGITVVLAWGVYQTIEKPCARLRRRLVAASSRPRAAPEPAVPALAVDAVKVREGMNGG